MATSIASLSAASASAAPPVDDPVADRYIQEVLSEINTAPPSIQAPPMQQQQQQQQQPQPAYYYPPPQQQQQQQQLQPFPTPLLQPPFYARFMTSEVRHALAVALVAFVVFSPVGEAFVDGLTERTPMREHKFAARCLVLGLASLIAFEGLKKMA